MMVIAGTRTVSLEEPFTAPKMDSKSPMPNPKAAKCHSVTQVLLFIPRATNDVDFLSETKRMSNLEVHEPLFLTEIFSQMQSLQILNRFYWWFLESRNGIVQPEWWYPIPTRAHETLWPSLKAQSKGPVRQWDIVNIQRHNKRSLFDVSILYMHWWYDMLWLNCDWCLSFSCR